MGASFDKYVKGDPTADARLMTSRWREDDGGRSVDSSSPPDGNLFSFYFRSRLDVARAGGGRFLCEDLRKGCPGQPGDDGEAKPYSYLSESMAKDSPASGGGAACVRSVSIPGKASLSGSKRRLGVKLALDANVRAEAGLRDGGRKLRARTRARLAGGRRTLVLRLSSRAQPGRYRLTLRIGCGRTKVSRAAVVSLRR